uniref:Putative gustatory receptor 11 n=1 Tax=Conopomorpha sinensis TaxID=940481 RepID=A0A3S7SGR1_9NEOP|nr:putative gustatory receptor 11 [Conopomorpha sinensis]
MLWNDMTFAGACCGALNCTITSSYVTIVAATLRRSPRVILKKLRPVSATLSLCT